MDTRRIRNFLALVEHGTFHKAAEAIHLSQSALSRSIQALEEELGGPLFDRTGHRVQLTPFGRSLTQRARQLLFEANQMQREMTLLRSGDLGNIAIGMSPTSASVCLRQCLSALARSHPQLHVLAAIGRTPEIIEDLRADKYDFGVVDVSAVDDTHGLEVEYLEPLPGGFLCRRGHPLLTEETVTIDALRQYPIACSPVSKPFAKRMVEVFGAEGHPDRLVTILCDNYEIQRDLALDSDVVLMSVFAIVRREIGAGDLLILKTSPELILPGRYAIVRLLGRTPSPAMDAICVEARKHFRA